MLFYSYFVHHLLKISFSTERNIYFYFLDKEEVEVEEDKVEELNELYAEAKMPIEEIIMKYRNKLIQEIGGIDKEDQPGSSKESSNSSSQSSKSSTSKLDHNFFQLPIWFSFMVNLILKMY